MSNLAPHNLAPEVGVGTLATLSGLVAWVGTAVQVVNAYIETSGRRDDVLSRPTLCFWAPLRTPSTAAGALIVHYEARASIRMQTLCFHGDAQLYALLDACRLHSVEAQQVTTSTSMAAATEADVGPVARFVMWRPGARAFRLRFTAP